jgi:hypothetical protein
MSAVLLVARRQEARRTSRDGERERPVIALGDEVDRRAHQRRLNDLPLVERLRHGVALESCDT